MLICTTRQVYINSKSPLLFRIPPIQLALMWYLRFMLCFLVLLQQINHIEFCTTGLTFMNTLLTSPFIAMFFQMNVKVNLVKQKWVKY